MRSIRYVTISVFVLGMAGPAIGGQTEYLILKYSDDNGNHEDSIIYQSRTGFGIGINGAPASGDTLAVHGDARFAYDLRLEGVLVHLGAVIKDEGGDTRLEFADTGPTRIKRADGIEVITIDTDSEVGIGQTSPSYTLDVTGAGRIADDLFCEGVLQISGNDIRDSDSDIRLSFPATGNMSINRSDGTEVITIAADGKVGIRDTSPSEVLDVNGDIGANQVKIYEGDLDVADDGTFSGEAVADAFYYWSSKGCYPEDLPAAYAAVNSLTGKPNPDPAAADHATTIVDYANLDDFLKGAEPDDEAELISLSAIAMAQNEAIKDLRKRIEQLELEMGISASP